MWTCNTLESVVTDPFVFSLGTETSIISSSIYKTNDLLGLQSLPDDISVDGMLLNKIGWQKICFEIAEHKQAMLWIFLWYRDFQYEDNILNRLSYLYYGNPSTGKTISLYWDGHFSSIWSMFHCVHSTASCVVLVWTYHQFFILDFGYMFAAM